VLNSKVILVADGLSPVGKAVVEMLSNGGHIVCFGCDPALSTVPTIGSATALKLDLTSRNHISKAITQILKTNGRLDVLAVNLAVVTPCSVEEHVNLSLIGLARLQRAVLPTMRAQGSGRIYTIVAKFGAADVPLQAWQKILRDAQVTLTNTLAQEIAGTKLSADVIYTLVFHKGQKRPHLNLNQALHDAIMPGLWQQYAARIQASFLSAQGVAEVAAEIVAQLVPSKSEPQKAVKDDGVAKQFCQLCAATQMVSGWPIFKLLKRRNNMKWDDV
jgi:NAD(P)-dependent dehydrogenase (short-subunit alcohol dehydrogenase family)